MIFLMWYISIIVAFGLAFFFILQREDPSDGEEAKNEYFENPQKSLLKTVVMSLTGELEFADIDFGMEYAMYGKLVRVIYTYVIELKSHIITTSILSLGVPTLHILHHVGTDEPFERFGHQ